MVNQWSALSVSTMASNAGVCACKTGEVKSEKGTRKKSEKMEKRGKEDKQGRQDALASQHALTSAFILAEYPLTRCQSPWHTEGMEQEKPVHPQSRIHCAHHDCAHCGPCALSSTSTKTCTVSVGEEHHRVLVEWC